MIKKLKHQSLLCVAQEFTDCASLFLNGILVKIIAYVDETGTHDPTGRLPGSSEAGIYGMAAPVEEWTKFNVAWKTVLNKYSVDYFHFCEWSTAWRRLKRGLAIKTGPYKDLSQAQLDRLIIELAKIAGDGSKIIIGQGMHVGVFEAQKRKGESPEDANPYFECIKQFFGGFVEDVKQFSPTWKRLPVDFFFDQAPTNKFRTAIHDAFSEAQKTHKQFKNITFADKKEFLPLQAADMVAYRTRQISQNFVEDKVSANWAELDEALFKPMFRTWDNSDKLRNQAMLESESHKAWYDQIKKRG